MRNILLALSVLGAIAATGCGAHQTSWKVRDQYGWPMQTWETNPNLQVAVIRRTHCVGFAHLGVVKLRFGQPVPCCEQRVSTNSYGARAALCGGRKNYELVGHVWGGKVVYTPEWNKPAPMPAPSYPPVSLSAAPNVARPAR